MEPAVLVNVPRWEAVYRELEEFRAFLAPDIPRFPLVVADDSEWDGGARARLRPEGYPTRTSGVTLVFAADSELLYVGHTGVTFAKRTNDYDNTLRKWEVKRRWTDVILSPRAYAFLGLSLEFFLICRLNPKCNTSYKWYEIPRRTECRTS